MRALHTAAHKHGAPLFGVLGVLFADEHDLFSPYDRIGCSSTETEEQLHQ
jgi:hypothetical protein